MTTNILTILIAAAVLAGSAAAAHQATDPCLTPAAVSAASSISSGGGLGFAAVAHADRFAAGAGGLRQPARRIELLTPRPSLAAD